MCGRRDIKQSSTVMLQPGRLQRTSEPIKLKKDANVQFKTVWKYAEAPGNRRNKPAKTGVGGKIRKEAETTGKTGQIFGSGPKGRG